jgi:GxxExxY protein
LPPLIVLITRDPTADDVGCGSIARFAGLSRFRNALFLFLRKAGGCDVAANVGTEWECQELCARILRAAMTVHAELGPGFLEKIYANALALELQKQSLHFQREARLSVYYDSQVLGEYSADLIVEGEVLVELKTVERFIEAHLAQVLHYLRCCRMHTGLLINFRSRILESKRLTL